jgi:poly(glycerol-phosphate) alpha-glucosyltransferase
MTPTPVHSGPLDVLHVMASASAAGFGVTMAVEPLVGALAGLGVRSACVALRDEQPPLDTWRAEVVTLVRRGPPALSYAPAFRAWYQDRTPPPALTHVHGLWGVLHARAMGDALRAGRPVVLSPHGALHPYAVRQKPWRKRFFRRYLLNQTLPGVSCLHALSEVEAEQCRAFGLRNPVAVIPNGVELPNERESRMTPTAIAGLPPDVKHVVLFLGRLFRTKGLVRLLAAWKQLAATHRDWGLVIAGPDQDGHRAELDAVVARDGLADRVRLPGMVTGESKAALLAAADLFVLPSENEGFSMAVLEAMAARTPVVVSTACNFPDVADTGAGRVLRPDASDLAGSMNAIMSAAPAERERMFAAARRLVEDRYTWPPIAARMLAVYRWLLGAGPRPDCVHLD